MAKLLLAKLGRICGKMEFKDMEVNVGLEMDLGKKIMETILNNRGQKIEEQTQGIVWVGIEISIKSCMDREEREVGVNSVGESRMDKTGRWKIEESQRDWKCSLKHVEAALDQ